MKVYTVTDIWGFRDKERKVVGVFNSLADAEECIFLNCYYDVLYEFNHYDCWGEDFFSDYNYVYSMLAYSHNYILQEWEV